MKINHIILLLCFTALISQCKSKKNTIIQTKTILILYSESYCGGAAPPEEMIADMNMVKPLKNTNIQIFKSNTSDLKTFKYKTNEKGEITVPISLGNQIFINIYTSLEDYNPEKLMYKCYKNFISHNLKMVDLNVPENEIQVLTRIECNPCQPVAP